MRRSSLPVLLLLTATASLLPLAPAPAAVETCQGQPVTVVWNEMTGAETTEGDDVVLAEPSSPNLGINGKGGDDLICIRGNLPPDSFGGGAGVGGGTGHDSLELRLGDGNDWLEMGGTIEEVDAELGGGFDELRLYDGHGRGSIDAGQGGGVISLSGDAIDLDLEDETLRVDGGLGRYSVSRFFRVFVSADRVVVAGDRKRNGIRVAGCDVTLRGGKGKDILQARLLRGDACAQTSCRLLGQKGDDRLDGSGANDVLIGGPGFDRANGSSGRDRCVAERESGCER